MTFLIVFICCAAELTYMSFEPFRKGQWIGFWHRWVANELGLRKWLGSSSFVVSLLVPCFLTALLFGHVLIDSTLLSMIAGIAILLFCSGPGDIAREIDSYTDSYLDEEGELPPPENANFLSVVSANDLDPDGPYMRAVAIQANDRLFAPAFWFAVLGPVGALLFRMSSALRSILDSSSAEHGLIERLYNILIWLPARLLGVALGLAGTLGPVIRVLREHDYGLSGSATLLADASIAALERHEHDDPGRGDEHIAAIISMFSLVKRGFVVWLVVLALLAAAGLV
ncbi:MAG: regulatory signaling modulator protein AmpE [Gammaproteobacteria bacterium]|jgi:membrane protein required for beta-lactamase induction|nr:regulatory signaling modulator protein AmpE [Gammaproteobacteria bacterium]